MHEPTPIPIHDLSSEPGSGAEAEPGDERSAPAEAATSGIDQVIDVLIGLVTLGASATTSIVRGPEDEPAGGTDNPTLVAGAAAGFLIEGLRAAGAMLTAVERTVVAPAAAAAGTAAERPEVRELLQHWQQSWDEQRERSDPAASEALRRGVRRAADALMEQLDTTDLVLEHVDIQRIAETVDINPLVDRLDMDRLADRIDMDALVARLDIEALIGRLDVAAIAAEVIEQLDIPDLIREVTAETTSEGVRNVRLRGVGADRAITKVANRLLGRADDAGAGS
jgi:hypothetical protein